MSSSTLPQNRAPHAEAQNAGPVSYKSRAAEREKKYIDYFGVPPRGLEATPYDNVAYVNYDLPHKFRGKSVFLAQTIEGYLMERDSFCTQVLLPWSETDEIHWEWSKTEFNLVAATRTPHEGVSRLLTKSYKRMQAHSVRHGIAFQLEVDFFNTDEGRNDYLLNIKGVGDVVQHTCNLEVLYELLNCKRPQQIWVERFGSREMDLETIMDYECSRHACLQKTDRAAINLIDTNRAIMLQNGYPEPDVLVAPPGFAQYLATPDKYEERVRFSTAGPTGEMMLKEGPKSIGRVLDIRVFEAGTITKSTQAEPLQLLVRAIRTGEYYGMIFDRSEREDNYSFTTKERDTYIYNENLDDFVKMSFIEAFRHCMLFNLNGNGDDDSDGNYSSFVTTYLGSKKPSDDFNKFDDPKKIPQYLFLTIPSDDNKKLQTATFFGELGYAFMSAAHVKQIAQSAAKAACKHRDIGDHIEKAMQADNEKRSDLAQNRVILSYLYGLKKPFPSSAVLKTRIPEVEQKIKDEVKRQATPAPTTTTTTTTTTPQQSSQPAATTVVPAADGGQQKASKLSASKKRDRIDSALGDGDEPSMFLGPEQGKSKISEPLLDSPRMKRRVEDCEPYEASVQLAALVFLSTRCDNGKSWINMMENDVLTPMNIIIWRIQDEHEMGSLILMKAGLLTGATYIGHGDMMLNGDAATKMIFGHFTYRSRSIVHSPNHVSILENVMAFRYGGGFNTQYIDSEEEVSELGKNRKSVLATAIPITEKELPPIMAFAGVLPMTNNAQASYSTSDFYNAVWGLRKYNDASRYTTRSYENSAEATNVIAYQGQQAKYNKSDGKYNRWVVSKGHRGRNGSQPGAREVFNGARTLLPDWDSSKYNNLD